jgi:hypothetical protein
LPVAKFGSEEGTGDPSAEEIAVLAPAITAPIGGFIRVEAESLADAEALLAGNPVFEDGTVEIRELPKDELTRGC